MNENQKIAVCVGGFLLVLAILFPPVKYTTLNSYYHSLAPDAQQQMLQGCLSDTIDCSKIYDTTFKFKLLFKSNVVDRIVSGLLFFELLVIGGGALGMYLKFSEDD